MSDEFGKRVEALSQEKRELLEMFLKEKRVDTEWLKESYVAPGNRIEEELAEIWQDVLGVERVGIHDNFFELGGDSILSIQIIAKANQAGLELASNHDLFERPTIAELSPLVTRRRDVEGGDELARPAEGPVPLTPLQAAQLAAGERLEPASFPALSVAAPALDRDRLGAVAGALSACHDALRLAYPAAAVAAGRAEPLAAAEEPPLAVDDATGTAERRRCLDRLAEQLDPAAGRLFGLAAFPAAGDGGEATVAAVFHPLAVDQVSLALLREELRQAVAAAAAGEPPELSPPRTSYQRWAQLLGERLAAEEGPAAGGEGGAATLPPSLLAAGGAGAESDGTIVRELASEETELMVRELPAQHRLQPRELIAAAVIAEIAAAEPTAERVRIDLESLGRAALIEGLDLSRTVGCLTAVVPVAVTPSADPGGLLRAVKEAAQEGASPAPSPTASPAPSPAGLLVGYRGQLDRELAGAGLGLLPRRPPYALQLVAQVEEGRLRMHWRRDPERVGQEAAEGLAEAVAQRLGGLVRHCHEAGGELLTPSDFPDAELSQDELSKLLGS